MKKSDGGFLRPFLLVMAGSFMSRATQLWSGFQVEQNRTASIIFYVIVFILLIITAFAVRDDTTTINGKKVDLRDFEINSSFEEEKNTINVEIIDRGNTKVDHKDPNMVAAAEAIRGLVACGWEAEEEKNEETV